MKEENDRITNLKFIFYFIHSFYVWKFQFLFDWNKLRKNDKLV